MARIVRQRERRDCGLACAAMLSGRGYRAARRVSDGLGLPWRSQGLTNKELQTVLGELGTRVEIVRRGLSVSRYSERCILRVRWSGDRARRAPGGHFVYVERGLAHDPDDGDRLPVAEYLGKWGGRACSALVAVQAHASRAGEKR